jgi:CheY-like chemotaxis protein
MTGGRARYRDPPRGDPLLHDHIRLSGLEPDRDIEVVFTGLRPGEKLTEELWYADENVGPTGQDKLLVVRQPANGNFVEFLPQLAELERLAVAGERGLLIHALRRMVPEYQPLGSDFLGQRRVLVVDDDPSRLLEKAHLLRWHARALAAAYLEYAWTHLRWVPRPPRAALHLDLFEQPERNRVFQQPARMRDLLVTILKDSYEVIQAADAAEAIARARAELPDLILLDITLPGVNGYSVCQTLKADPRTQPVPIVMLSALADVEEKVRGIDMGGGPTARRGGRGQRSEVRGQGSKKERASLIQQGTRGCRRLFTGLSESRMQ